MTNQVVTLFSGAGGISLGFAQAGLPPSMGAEIDADACETYRSNFDAPIHEVDLAKPSAQFVAELASLKDPFILVGGPPCQGFSSAGLKDGTDERNKLIFSYFSLVDLIRPRWFLFENVEGLLTYNRGRSIERLVLEFLKVGYRIRLEKVNFAEYGLPQARKRVVLVGNRMGIDFDFPKSTHSFNAGKHKKMSDLPIAPSIDFALSGLGPAEQNDNGHIYPTANPTNAFDALMRTGNEGSPITLHYALPSGSNSHIISLLKPGQTMKDLPEDLWHDSFRKRAYRRVKDGTPTERRGGPPSGLKRLRGDLSALTITSAAVREFIHPNENRALTLRECARLQSFPDKHRFAGRPNSIIRQIGNAFPPLAAKVFADHLAGIDGRFGTGIPSKEILGPGLIDYKLTEATAMSPALARTDDLLSAIASPQDSLFSSRHLGDVA